MRKMQNIKSTDENIAYIYKMPTSLLLLVKVLVFVNPVNHVIITAVALVVMQSHSLCST